MTHGSHTLEAIAIVIIIHMCVRHVYMTSHSHHHYHPHVWAMYYISRTHIQDSLRSPFSWRTIGGPRYLQWWRWCWGSALPKTLPHTHVLNCTGNTLPFPTTTFPCTLHDVSLQAQLKLINYIGQNRELMTKKAMHALCEYVVVKC